LTLTDFFGYWAWKCAVWILLLWGIGLLLTGPLQHWFIFRPKKLAVDYAYHFTLSPEEVWMDTPQGGRLNALWFKPRGTPSRKGVILFFHGNAGNLSRWGHLHHYFGRYGYDFFVYDYRGYGKSTGRRNQYLLYKDALTAYRTIACFYPSDQIILYGRSLGSAFATHVAASEAAKLLILETPFYSMKDLFYTYFPFLPRMFAFRYPFPSHEYLGKVSIPTIIFQGTEDRIVPMRSARRLKGLLKPGDTFIAIPGGGHNNLQFYDIYNQKMEQLLN
jgi:hypothetical protein